MLLGLFALVFPARCVLLPILYWCQGGGRGVAAHPDFRNLFFRLQSPPPQLVPLLASVTIVEMSPEGVSMMWGINGWAVGDNCVVFCLFVSLCPALCWAGFAAKGFFLAISWEVVTWVIFKAKILLKFFYLIGTRKLEVIGPITWTAPETCG